MAKFILLNTVWVGNARLGAGSTIDTSLGDSVATITAAGGALVPFTDAAMTAAAAVIASLRLNGHPPEQLDTAMLAALGSELLTSATTVQGFITLSLNDLRIVDANNLVANGAANGGLLASDTVPPLGGASKQQIITWATSSVVSVSFQKGVPADLDPTASCTLELTVASGTTDAATFTVQVVWDNAAAASYTADDTATKSATQHKITATLLAADIPVGGPANIGVILTPGAHGTDTVKFAGMRLFYKKKILAA